MDCSFGNCDAWIWQAKVHPKVSQLWRVGPIVKLNDLSECRETVMEVGIKEGIGSKQIENHFMTSPKMLKCPLAWKSIYFWFWLTSGQMSIHMWRTVWESPTQYTLLQNVGFLLSTFTKQKMWRAISMFSKTAQLLRMQSCAVGCDHYIHCRKCTPAGCFIILQNLESMKLLNLEHVPCTKGADRFRLKLRILLHVIMWLFGGTHR